MNFQTHCERYLQRIRRTQESAAATPELSLFPHLQAFLEALSVDHFRRNTIRFVQEPRRLDQIGRPDFVAMDGLLPIGYIEAEAYGRDLNNLTGHAREQNARFIENLDNFILTNFVDFQLWTEGRLRADASIADGTGAFETLLERFLNAEPIQIATPEALARYLARRTREFRRHFRDQTRFSSNSFITSLHRTWRRASQYFTDVPEEVWAYEVGSYRVCEKWLRDRRGAVLRHEDVRRYRAILVSVAGTLGVMREIDAILWDGV